MKLSPEDSRLTERMAPGALCAEGFLGDDLRPLGEVLDADRSTVEGLGVTHRQIAERLGEAVTAAMRHLGAPVTLHGHVTGVYRESMGRIPCPWGDGVRPKGEVELTDRDTGATLRVTPLSVHLIAAHGFYQGRGSRYRIEPADVCRMFGLPAETEG